MYDLIFSLSFIDIVTLLFSTWPMILFSVVVNLLGMNVICHCHQAACFRYSVEVTQIAFMLYERLCRQCIKRYHHQIWYTVAVNCWNTLKRSMRHRPHSKRTWRVVQCAPSGILYTSFLPLGSCRDLTKDLHLLKRHSQCRIHAILTFLYTPLPCFHVPNISNICHYEILFISKWRFEVKHRLAFLKKCGCRKCRALPLHRRGFRACFIFTCRRYLRFSSCRSQFWWYAP